MLQRMMMEHCLVWGEPYGSSRVIDRPSRNRYAASPRPGPPETPGVGSPATGASGWARSGSPTSIPPCAILLEAHLVYFRTLFAEPSRRGRLCSLGFEGSPLRLEHAVDLVWLFPLANPSFCCAILMNAGRLPPGPA